MSKIKKLLDEVRLEEARPAKLLFGKGYGRKYMDMERGITAAERSGKSGAIVSGQSTGSLAKKRKARKKKGLHSK